MRKWVIAGLAFFFAELGMAALAGPAGAYWVNTPGISYLLLALGAVLGVSLIIIPDQMQRRL